MSLTLEIANLSKTYPNGVRALRDVSITIPTGRPSVQPGLTSPRPA